METFPSQAYTLFRDFNPFHNIIHYYVDLSCFLITPPPRDWWALNRRKRSTSLYALEVKYRSEKARDRFLSKGFDLSLKERRTVCVDRLGFKDFFVPILKGQDLLGHLQAGAFSSSEITLPVIEECWRELSGLEPSPELPEFREFVRVLLEIPVLDGPLMPAFQESLELFARLLSDDAHREALGKRLRHLLLTVFSKGLPHSFWMDWALGRPTSESVPPWRRDMEKWGWTNDEIGLTRVPTTVLTVIPRQAGGTGLDWTREFLRIYRFQRRSFLFAQTLPQSVGGRLDDYGAVFVTSADPKLGRLAQRQQVQGLAKRIREFAREELGTQVLVGIGETVAPGEPLNDSYRQAVLALHLRHHPEKDIIFFNDTKKEGPRTGGYSRLRQVLDDLEQALVSGSIPSLDAWQEKFLDLALNLSFQNPHEIRWHFRYALDRLAGTLTSKLGLEKEESLQVREGLGRDMEGAANTQELVAAFQKELSRMVEMQSRPSALGKVLTLERTREYVDQHFTEPLRISRLAKMSGVSISTFSRAFKKLTGTGLEGYLQGLRLEAAKRLLKSGNLPVSRIAKDCGFGSNSYFTRLFRAKVGVTPKKFRQGKQ